MISTRWGIRTRWFAAIAVVVLATGPAWAQLPPAARVETPPLPPGAILVPGPRAGTGREPTDPPVPVVAIRVRVAAVATPGQDLDYRLLVENNSPASAHHVLVRTPVPANAEFVRAQPEPVEQKPELIWRLGTLKGGERREIVLTVKPTGEGDLQACARVQFEHGECVRTRLAKQGQSAGPAPSGQPPKPLPSGPPAATPGLRIRKSALPRAVVNDLVSFQIDVTNTGSVPAADLLVADKLPDGLDFLDGKPAIDVSQTPRWNLGTLAPGQTQRIEYRAVAKREGTFTNRVEVTASAGVKETAEATVTVGEPKLSLALSGPHAALVGRPATYVITVANPGSAVLKNLRLSQRLIREITLDSSAPQGKIVADAAEKSEKIVWSLGDVEPGARKTVQVKYTAARAGTFDLWVNADADRTDFAQDAYATTRFLDVPKPAVLIDKRGEDLVVGAERTLTVWAVNLGSADARDLDLIFTLSEGIEAKDLVGATAADSRVLKFKQLSVLGKNMEYALGRLTVTASRAGEATLSFELRAAGKVVDKDDEKLVILPPPQPRP